MSKRNRKNEEPKEYNQELQPILDLLPYGPALLNQSQPWQRNTGDSVQTKGYPLLPPPYGIRISDVKCLSWKRKTYEIFKGLTVERDRLLLSYVYDLADDKRCMLLYTKGERDVITISVGDSGKRRTARLLREKYRQYKDILKVVWKPQYMDYAAQCLIPYKMPK